MSDGNDVLDVRGTVSNAPEIRSFDFPAFARTATTFNGEGGDDTLAVDLATSFNATYDGGSGVDLLIMDWSRSNVGIQRFGDGYRSYSHTETVNNQPIDRFFTMTYTNVERFDITTGKSTVLFGTNPFPFSGLYANANDSVVGGALDDRFKVWGGHDTVVGGAGNDTLVVDWSLWDHYNNQAVGTTITGSLATGYSGRIHTDRPWFNNSVIEFPDSVDFTGIEKFDVTLRNFGDCNDLLTTGDGDDTVRGMAGNDTINTAGGVDSIDGGVGDADRWIADKSFMTAGQAMVVDLNASGVQGTYLGAGSVAGIETLDLTTGAGNDVVVTRVSQQSDIVSTGGGDDVVKVSGGIDTVNGGAGNDLLILDWSLWNPYTSRAVGTTISGSLALGYFGAFDDTYSGDRVDFSGIERFDLTLRDFGDNSDSVTTGDGDDIVRGMAGNDTINTAGGNDYLDGGEGDDRLDGGAGNDTILTGAGTDRAFGGDGIDTIYMGDGNDYAQADGGASSILSGDAGNDTLYGGSGNDYMIGGEGNDVMVGLGGVNSMYGGAGDDLVIAGDGAGSVVDGGAGSNSLWGGNGADYMVGGELADVMVAGAGGDYIFGNAGADAIYAGAGTDYIFGNAGNEFVYTDDIGVMNRDFLYVGGGTGVDTVADFTPGAGANSDVLVVSPASGLASFAQAQAAMTQVGVYTVLTMAGGDQVYLYNVQPFQVTANNFIFI